MRWLRRRTTNGFGIEATRIRWHLIGPHEGAVPYPLEAALREELLHSGRVLPMGGSVHRARRLRARAQNPSRYLEPVVQRNPLVEQKRCRGRIALRRFITPATLLPAGEWWACLFHDASLADRRRARSVRVLRHARLVCASVLTPRTAALLLGL